MYTEHYLSDTFYDMFVWMKQTFFVYKNLGETPLEAIERSRAEQVNRARQKNDQGVVTYWTSVPMTYAGRLDPMAEGELLVLVGDECKNKDKYLGLDKEYEVEILFGVETDTYDTLGLAVGQAPSDAEPNIDIDHMERTYRGRFMQPYPPYSSKAVSGKQMHEWTRAGGAPEEIPEKEVEIYELKVLGVSTISARELEGRIMQGIARVRGDFRQERIVDRWHQILDQDRSYTVMKIHVFCSSGTYMRSLAQRMGKDMGCGACALSIRRTRIVMR